MNHTKTRNATYLGHTTSTCPECLQLIPVKIMSNNGSVYFDKHCPEHGMSKALISEDTSHYLKCRDYARPGTIPLKFNSEVQQGCPKDCGLCPQHEQHCCHPIVEITDCCDLACPICIADNRSRGFMPVDSFKKIVDNLVDSEGHLENITLSGGEPTLHPDFWTLVKEAQRPEVSRVSLVTNGLKISKDLSFCKQLVDNNVYVILQWDGVDKGTHIKLRGRDLSRIKQKALDNLEKYNIPVQLIFVAAKGINEQGIGEAIKLLFSKDHILSIAFQPLAFIGKGGSTFECDPMNRTTIPGVINELEKQSQGVLKKDDFFPLPCPNPECISLTYLLKMDDGSYVPFPRFMDIKKYLHMLSNSATLPPDQNTEEAMQEIINDLWSTTGEIPDSKKITSALRRAILEIYSKNSANYQDMVRATERQAKSIFIHHYMDRYNFDLARVIKCCHHYPRADIKIYPICAYNMFYR